MGTRVTTDTSNACPVFYGSLLARTWPLGDTSSDMPFPTG